MHDMGCNIENTYASGSRKSTGRTARTLLFAVAVAVTAALPVTARSHHVNHSLYSLVCPETLSSTASANGAAPTNNITPANSTTTFDWQSITPSTDIQWAPCYDGQQCTRLLLPLDYHSNGSSNATTAIAMRMIPARDRANYRGAVLVNQGGPGYSGTAFIGSFGSNLSAIIGDSFDVLGFDPRGIGESTPRLDCFQTQSERDTWNAQEGTQLLNASDESLLNWYVARAQVVGGLCAAASAQQGDIARFMDTGSVATDMLNIVEKLGQEKLQYWGFSYGTVLGQYFAAMYPDKIGRMIIDGVYDGDNYRASLWNSNAIDSETVIDSLFTFCHQAGPQGCALYESTPSAIRKRFFRVLDGLKENPVPMPLAQPPIVFGYKDAVAIILDAVYNPIQGYPLVVTGIHTIETANQTLLTEQPRELAPSPHASAGESDSLSDPLYAVACGDADPQTFDRQAYQKFFEDLTHVAPTVGPIWALNHLQCTQWQARPKWRYTGPLAATNTSHPILIVQPRFDPAAPLHDALAVRKRYAGTGLLVQNSYGHTSTGAPSACTAKYVREYLEAGTLPAEGTVCQPDVLPLVGAVSGA